MQKQNDSREVILRTLATEIDQALRIWPVVHIKHSAATSGQHGLGGLESHLLGFKDGQQYSLHDWGYYGDVKAPSMVIPGAPRGFAIALKKDSDAENKSRGSDSNSIPLEAKTANYTGDYIKIDWVYPHKDIIGMGIPRKYFYAVECGAKKSGYPSLHIDATNNGLSYWARKEFGLKIPEENHANLVEFYQHFKVYSKECIQKARSISPYIHDYDEESFPDEIDPTKPYSIPRIFMEVLGAIYMSNGWHLHFFKKF